MRATSNDTPRADRGFVLRTPLLPLETFEAWRSAPDARAFLDALVTRADIREALFIATPSLSDGLDKWRNDPDSPGGQQVELALARYVARMAARCTPFGLFSAVSAGKLGADTKLELAAHTDYQRRTRIDNDYIFALLEALGKHPEVRARLPYRPNSSLYSIGDRLRYAEARLVNKERSYHLVSIDATPYLRAALDRAQGGSLLSELAEGIVADDTEVSLDEARAYVDELVAAQVIVPNLGITVTGPEPIEAVVAQLSAAGLDEPARVLARARDALADIDRRSIGNEASAYLTIASTLEQLPAKVELARLFQVDMVKPAVAVLATKTAADVLRTIEWLHSLQRVPSQTSLDEFRAAFSERYEARIVPLVEALDEEAGVGFETTNTPGGEGSPLLAGLRFPHRGANEQAPWGNLERHMQRRLAAGLRAAADEIVLDDTDRKGMLQDAPPTLPDAFHAQIRLRKGAATDAQILFEGASGPSGARMLGRFCHASPDIEAIVREHLRLEEAHQPNAVFAEVVHLNEGRIGNILCRPVLREHEIVFLGLSGAPPERQLPIEDLLVTVRGERIVLLSRKLGCEVVPRLTSAHNFRLRSLGLYRFLCALQEGVAVQWSWGTLERAPMLPRVRIGNVIVSRRTWNLSASELEPITMAARDKTRQRRKDIAAAVAQLREHARLPRFVVIADYDNELAIDLENPALVHVFADELAGRDGAKILEQFPEPDASPVRGPEGTFANQLTLLFSRAPSQAALRPSPPRHASVCARRSFPPGSSWLYAKLYTGTATADRVLREAIVPLVRNVLESADATHWFFIRYGDPQNHLRIRFAGEPTKLSANVLPALNSALDSLREKGLIWKVQLDTYERELERYGGAQAIELVEQLFWIDSEAVLGIIELLEGDAGADARWRLALRGSESLLEVFGFDPDARFAIFAGARDSLAREYGVGADFFAPIGDRYKRERSALEELFIPDVVRDAAHELSSGFELLARRDERLRPIAGKLRALDAAGELAPSLRDMAWSLVHMHVNRLLHASQRAQELVLYDLLRRLHESRRARKEADRVGQAQGRRQRPKS